MNEDIYTIEKRNEIIQKAIKSYKFKGFNYIKMEELFALKNIITFLKGMAGH